MTEPWRYGVQGLSLALKVTSRGGRDAIDGVEILANGKRVLSVRVRAIAEGGEANRAVIDLLGDVLGVPKRHIRVLSGTASRHKQVAIDGDAAKLGDALRKLVATATAKD